MKNEQTSKRQVRGILPAGEYVEGILRGDRTVLGRAITLIESTRPEHRAVAEEVLDKCLSQTGRSLRVAVTGPPGAGKSSFIETFGTLLTNEKHRKLAVLAVDPTSQMSRGSILGDKTRMEKLAANPNAFIRPSPSGGALGGVAAHTREAMLLCEAAGYDTIFIETVGVGQSETTVHGMTDFFLLLLMPGSGDELQGIKRGIVEMADLIAVNKADGERTELARSTRRDYANALRLYPPKPSGWQPPSLTCSAHTGTGMAEIWELMQDFHRQAQASGWFLKNRQEQARQWFHEQIESDLKRLFFGKEEVRNRLERIEMAVMAGEMSPVRGARELLGMEGAWLLNPSSLNMSIL